MRNFKLAAEWLFIGLFLMSFFQVEAAEMRELRQSGFSPAPVRRAVREKVKGKIKNLRFTARISGTIGAISGNVLTVTAGDGKTYTVNVTSETKLKRRFLGSATLSEFAAGHQVEVIGKWTADTKTTIDARLIRNRSIERRWGAFFGKVTQKNSGNFVIETVNRGSQTVYFGSTTQFVKRNMETMIYDDLAVGHRVRVKGVWDREYDKIIEIDQVKDFSLPAVL